MNIFSFADKLKQTVDKRINTEGRAVRATVHNGKVAIGNQHYHIVNAVDADSSDGKKVWVLKSNDNRAVVIGA